MSDDPWDDDPAGAIARGRALYHDAAGCTSCHAAYVDVGIATDYARAAGMPTDLRPDISTPVRTDSARGPLRASDFRSGAPLRGGGEAVDSYRVIAAGVGGTAMPTWKGMLPEADLWALAHYVRSLIAAGDSSQM